MRAGRRRMNQPRKRDYLLGDDHDEMHRLSIQHLTWQPKISAKL